MSRFVDEPTVTRRIGECQCPGTPHADGDTVTLDAVLDLSTGFAAISAMAKAAEKATEEKRELTAPELAIAVAPSYFTAIRSWNLVDEKGEGEPCTPANIARLPWSRRYRIADIGDDLYGADLISPLVEPTPKLSSNGQTASSTSANRQSRRHPPPPSKQSSDASSAGVPSVTAP